MPPLASITEKDLANGDPRFPLNGHVAFRVLCFDNTTIIRFGDLSVAGKSLYAAVCVLAVGSVPLLVKFQIPAPIAVLPMLVIFIVLGIFFVRQRSFQGIELRLEPKRCTFKIRNAEARWEPIEQVLVINSHAFRDGAPATEGISELFFCLKEEPLSRRFLPIVSGPNYGEWDDLARIIAKAVGAELEIQNH